mgnify:CR=1 FL=1
MEKYESKNDEFNGILDFIKKKKRDMENRTHRSEIALSTPLGQS